mmetsp:Transcript_44326/g.107132  ORF Transcript_44326/g.107132 Transcript_44326/m.107132 type:complete len:193 (-) Transcript_44326:2333-2911(-)
MPCGATPAVSPDVSILDPRVDTQVRISTPMALNRPEDQHIDNKITGYGINNGRVVAKAAPTAIIRPMPDDVLFGLSKNIKNHPGNVRFRQLVNMNMDVYYSSSSTRTTKADISKAIVNELTRSSGGRFLKKRGNEDMAMTNHGDATTMNNNSMEDVEETNEWVEVDYKEARQKVAHHFRNRWKALVKNKAKK